MFKNMVVHAKRAGMDVHQTMVAGENSGNNGLTKFLMFSIEPAMFGRSIALTDPHMSHVLNPKCHSMYSPGWLRTGLMLDYLYWCV